MRDSSTSSRSTANRTGASGIGRRGRSATRRARPAGTGSPTRPADARRPAMGEAPRPGPAIGGDRVHAEQVRPGERHAGGAARRRRRARRRSRPGRSTRTPVAPAGIGSVTGSPGAIASAALADPPSSSPARFASRTGNATWSGRSDRRGSKARTAAGRPASVPAYRSGDVPRARDHGPRPGGQLQPLRLGDVDRGQVDVAQDRVGRRRAPPMPGFVSVP